MKRSHFISQQNEQANQKIPGWWPILVTIGSLLNIHFLNIIIYIWHHPDIDDDSSQLPVSQLAMEYIRKSFPWFCLFVLFSIVVLALVWTMIIRTTYKNWFSRSQRARERY